MEITTEDPDMAALYSAQSEKATDLAAELNMLKLREESLSKQIDAERAMAENSRHAMERVDGVLRRMQAQVGLLLSSIGATLWCTLTIVHANKPLARSTVIVRKPEGETAPEELTPRDLVRRAAEIVKTFPVEKVPQATEWAALLEEHNTEKLRCSVIDLGGASRPVDLDCVDPGYFTSTIKVTHGSDFVLKIQ